MNETRVLAYQTIGTKHHASLICASNSTNRAYPSVALPTVDELNPCAKCQGNGYEEPTIEVIKAANVKLAGRNRNLRAEERDAYAAARTEFVIEHYGLSGETAPCPICEQPVGVEEAETVQRFIGSFLTTEQVARIGEVVSFDHGDLHVADEYCSRCLVQAATMAEG